MLRQLITLSILTSLLVTLLSCGGDTSLSSDKPTQSDSSIPTVVSAKDEVLIDHSGVVTVINRDLGGSGAYAYEPSEFSFKAGDTVTFVNIAETELHSFTIDDLGIDVDIDGGTNPGQEESVTITFDKPGVYPVICIYHEGNGMLGTITVE